MSKQSKKPTPPAAPAAKKRPGPPADSPKRAAFLEAYRKLGNITAACAAVGCSTSSHRQTWIKDPEYLRQFEEAQQDARERLESFAIQRATRADKPSDLLLIFLLKAAWPEKYRETVTQDHTGKMQIEVKMFGQEAPVDRV